MEFTLKYRGEVRRGDATIKHALRCDFHEQLRAIWRDHNVLSRIDRSALPAPVKSADDRYDLPRPLKPVGDQALSAFLFRFVLRGTVWVPLVTFPMEAHCHLAIRLGRPVRPGTILFGEGDIDNRIKIILDALRMPQVPQEVPSVAKAKPEMFSLLADDNLVTRLSITTYRLLTDSTSSAAFMDVDIDVTLRAITPMAGTVALLF